MVVEAVEGEVGIVAMAADQHIVRHDMRQLQTGLLLAPRLEQSPHVLSPLVDVVHHVLLGQAWGQRRLGCSD